jgi:hypothetical protein
MIFSNIFFVLVFLLGALGLQTSKVGPLSHKLMGEIFFAGGFIPLVMTLQGFITEMFEGVKGDLLYNPNVGMSFLFLVLGICLLIPRPDDGF